MEGYIKPPISNGNPIEQGLIRKWWYEEHNAGGLIVWEYNLEGRYLDAVWFPNESSTQVEEAGLNAPKRFPLAGKEIVTCEAKINLTPELIGQALVYKQFALHAGALVKDTIIFSENAQNSMIRAAKKLGLKVVSLTKDMKAG